MRALVPHLLAALLLFGSPGAAADAPAAAPAVAPAPAPAARAAAPAVDPLAPNAALPPELEQDSGTLLGAVVRMVVALGIVMALIYITLNYGLRRFLGMRAPVGRELLSVLERVPLDSKRSLLVVKAAGEYLLVGAADGGLSLLSKLDAETVERLRRERQQPPPATSPLWLKLLSRKAQPPSGPEGSNP
jgi:flagellar protein FliO/FliZ